MKALSILPPVVLPALFGIRAIQRGRTTRFIRRQGTLRAEDFARTFCVFVMRGPDVPLARRASERAITASALAQRLQQRATATALRALRRGTLDQRTRPQRRRTVVPLLTRVTRVALADGTTRARPANGIRRLRGCGGGANTGDRTAAGNVLRRIDLSTGQSTERARGSGRTPDVHRLDTLKPRPTGTLEIADLGFFDTDRFRAHNRRGVWWWTRLPARIRVRPVGSDDGVELADGLKHRNRTAPDRWDGTLPVTNGSPLSMRVLVPRCPPKEAARRRRDVQARAKKKGETVGWRPLVLCDGWVLATNAGADLLTASEATERYPARWQIELVFERWTRLGHVRVPSDLSTNRAACELYGRLLGVLVIDGRARRRGGPVSDASVGSAWPVVLGMLDRIIRAVKGWINWDIVMIELITELKAIPKPAPRKKQPRTRQRLLNT